MTVQFLTVRIWFELRMRSQALAQSLMVAKPAAAPMLINAIGYDIFFHGEMGELYYTSGVPMRGIFGSYVEATAYGQCASWVTVQYSNLICFNQCP